ncbi:MAG: glycosyltransferase [Silicimonas sp.]|nr:glycosyltransferase [Silicimonas sp.]
MLFSRISSVPRLTWNAVTRLLDVRTEIPLDAFKPIVKGGETVGWIERVVWQRERVRLTGWCSASGVCAGFEGQRPILIEPWIERSDVQHDHPGTSLVTGFEIELARGARDAPVLIGVDGDVLAPDAVRLEPPSRGREMSTRMATLPAALGYAFGYRRDIIRFIGTGDSGLSVALRDAFGFGFARDAVPMVPSDFFAETDREITPPQCNTVLIVPIFNAPGNVAQLLERLETTVDIPHHILLVDDASVDPAIPGILATFAAKAAGRITIETLRTNQGFVGAVNHGLRIARDLGEHVILINSDTLPPANWAGRLIAPIVADPNVASVTPVSNTAEIASIPAQGVISDVTPELADTIDATACRIGQRYRTIPIPTGIGFAMAMNRRFLDLIGDFDPAFGRGYGEEVDWCQKARDAGGEHLLATSVFIGHQGGTSFGSEEKRARVAAAGQIITARYPAYDGEVRKWAEAAPHAVQRTVLSLAWLDEVSDAPVPIFLGHTLGGGAALSLSREISGALESGAPAVVVVRVGGSAAWQLEIIGATFHHRCRVGDLDMLESLLAPLSTRNVVYSCGVGARNPRDVPAALLRLSHGSEHNLELRLHDFFAVSPSYCLLDHNGRYPGVPDGAAPCAKSHLPTAAGQAEMTHRQWRALWTPVIEKAGEVIAYSASSAAVLSEAYPNATAKTRVFPHDLPDDLPGPVAAGGSALGVLGAINQAKGADVIIDLARHLRHQGSPMRIVVVGDLDPNYRLSPPHRVTGRYERSEIDRLARKHDIGLWLIPSVWPETFSFATREALATGLPVLTFELGAQAEAATAAPNGHVLKSPPDDTAALAEAIEACIANPERATS